MVSSCAWAIVARTTGFPVAGRADREEPLQLPDAADHRHADDWWQHEQYENGNVFERGSKPGRGRADTGR